MDGVHAAVQADILDHRQEQIKAEEVKLRSLVQQIERLEADLSKTAEEVGGRQGGGVHGACAGRWCWGGNRSILQMRVQQRKTLKS